MTRQLFVVVGLIVCLSSIGTDPLHAEPEKKEIVFEDRPLLSWLAESFDTQYSIEMQDKAREALARFCADPEQATLPLTAALAHKNEFVRHAATIFLGRYCASEASWAVPPLLKSLQSDKSILVRADAADALGCIDPKSKAVRDALLKALTDDRADFVRETVIRRLRWMELTEGVPALTVALKDEAAGVRIQAAFGLMELGEPKAVTPLLIAALDDEKTWWDVALSLGDLCPGAIPALRTALEDKRPLVRAGAVRALGKAKESAMPQVRRELPAIIALLDDKDSRVRENAARTIGLASSGTKEGVPALMGKLDAEDASLRRECIDALGWIGRDAAGAVDKLTNLLKDHSAVLRSATAQALGRIGPAAKTAVPALIEALKDENQDVRWNAASALGDIGAEAKAAIPKLKEASESTDKLMKRRAERALKKIEPDDE